LYAGIWIAAICTTACNAPAAADSFRIIRMNAINFTGYPHFQYRCRHQAFGRIHFTRGQCLRRSGSQAVYVPGPCCRQLANHLPVQARGGRDRRRYENL